MQRIQSKNVLPYLRRRSEILVPVNRFVELYSGHFSELCSAAKSSTHCGNAKRLAAKRWRQAHLASCGERGSTWFPYETVGSVRVRLRRITRCPPAVSKRQSDARRSSGQGDRLEPSENSVVVAIVLGRRARPTVHRMRHALYFFQNTPRRHLRFFSLQC